MNNDPQKILDENPMSTMQFVAVAMCVLLNALDGFDVLSIAFSARESLRIGGLRVPLLVSFCRWN